MSAPSGEQLLCATAAVGGVCSSSAVSTSSLGWRIDGCTMLRCTEGSRVSVMGAPENISSQLLPEENT